MTTLKATHDAQEAKVHELAASSARLIETMDASNAQEAWAQIMANADQIDQMVRESIEALRRG